MQTDNRLLDDMARVASGALGALAGVRQELEALFRQQFETFVASMDLVTREEFEAVRAMAVKARAEQAELAARVAALEARLGAKPAAVKPAPARPEGAKRKRATRKPPTP